MTAHIQAECTHDNGCCSNCMACQLAVCTVCRGIEGDLTTHCCGRPMTKYESQQVYKGNLNYINGVWVDDPPPTRLSPSSTKEEVEAWTKWAKKRNPVFKE